MNELLLINLCETLKEGWPVIVPMILVIIAFFWMALLASDGPTDKDMVAAVIGPNPTLFEYHLRRKLLENGEYMTEAEIKRCVDEYVEEANGTLKRLGLE